MAKHAQGSLPQFIAVGPPRTATTWLHHFLRGRVSLPEGVKETNYFSWNYHLGLDWYRWHFRNSVKGQPVLEIGPAYFELEESRERIARHLPGCRIICTFRDPVERLYSHYKLWRMIGLVEQPFEEVAAHNEQLQSINRYASHLAAWQSRFGRDRVLVLFYEDMRNTPQTFFDDLCDFIGIARFDVTASPMLSERIHSVERAPRNLRLARFAREATGALTRHRLHKLRDAAEPLWRFCFGRGEIFGPLDIEVERRLRAALRPEIERFEQMVGRDLSAWKDSESSARSQITNADVPFHIRFQVP
jgi:hypothetical protein